MDAHRLLDVGVPASQLGLHFHLELLQLLVVRFLELRYSLTVVLQLQQPFLVQLLQLVLELMQPDFSFLLLNHQLVDLLIRLLLGQRLSLRHLLLALQPDRTDFLFQCVCFSELFFLQLQLVEQVLVFFR